MTVTLHLPLIPGESPDNPSLAFTVLADRFGRMMEGEGFEVATYEVEAERPGWDDRAEWDRLSLIQARGIRANLTGRDLVCLPAGAAQRKVMEQVPIPAVEPFVGYAGTCASWRVFPSWAWMHTVIGAEQGAYAADGTWGDVVIEHPLDPDQHTLGQGDGGYLLFVGRLIERKGLDTAIAIAKATGYRLLAAGEGDYRPDGPEYLGAVDPAERDELMGAAVALLAPTTYIEPFGLVAIEAQASGTPAITTDWGAFTETVESQYRSLTLDGFVKAVEAAEKADRTALRDRALARWSPDTIAPLYSRFLARIAEEAL